MGIREEPLRPASAARPRFGVALLAGALAAPWLGACAGGGATVAVPPTTPGAGGASAQASPSVSSPPESVSIYPVPSPHVAVHEPSRTATPSPAPASPSPAPGGINCGLHTDAVDHHVQVSTTYECYEVEGSTLPQLRSALAREGPRVEGTRRPAATRWRVRWGYSFEAPGGVCEVTKPEVEVVLTYFFPAWQGSGTASPKVMSAWDALMEDLRSHEAGHGKLAIEAGIQVRRALLAAPSGADCAQVSEKADAQVKEVLAEYRHLQAALDAA